MPPFARYSVRTTRPGTRAVIAADLPMTEEAEAQFRSNAEHLAQQEGCEVLWDTFGIEVWK